MKPQFNETVRTEEAESLEREFGGGQRRDSPRKNSRVLLYTVPALLLALFAGLIYWRVQTRQHVKAELMPSGSGAETVQIPVAVVHPQPSDQNPQVTFPGDVQAYVTTPIYARTDGYLKSWYVDIGGRVKAGQLLATIETPEIDDQLRQAQAAQAQAQANLDLAKTTAERWQNLLKSDGVSQQEVDQNLGAYKARQADYSAAAANVERLKSLQSFQRVVAPFDGIVTARNVDIGALISSGNTKQLFQMAQIGVLRVYVNVSESYSAEIRIGMPADIHLAEFPGRTFVGKVAHTAGAIDPASRTLLTEVQVPNPRAELMPGSYAQVTFHVKEGTPPLVVPANTLIFRSDGPQIALVENGNTARLRKVTIGRDFGTNLEIVSGLRPSDTAILNPPDSLADGAAVIVTETADSSGSSQSGQNAARPAAAGR